jgi:membrane protein DedA with SNARE-associated domain
MSLEHLLTSYGYLAIIIGTFLEGETILILAGFLAHRGYLELHLVILCAFLGTLLGDQLYFYIGYFMGREALARRPRWKNKAERVFSLLASWQSWLILGFRFLYGLRTVTPFIIGTSKISPLRFLILNMLGGLIWATSIGALGYLFGHSLGIMISDIKRYELIVFAGITGIGLGVHYLCRRVLS